MFFPVFLNIYIKLTRRISVCIQPPLQTVPSSPPNCPGKPSEFSHSPHWADSESAQGELTVRTVRTLSPQGSTICGLQVFWGC